MPTNELTLIDNSIKKEAKQICRDIFPIIIHEANKQIEELKANNYREFNPLNGIHYTSNGISFDKLSYTILDSLFNNAFITKTDLISEPLLALVSTQKERILYNHLKKEIQNILLKEFHKSKEYLIVDEMVGYYREKERNLLLVNPDAIKKRKQELYKQKQMLLISIAFLFACFYFIFPFILTWKKH